MRKKKKLIEKFVSNFEDPVLPSQKGLLSFSAKNRMELPFTLIHMNPEQFYANYISIAALFALQVVFSNLKLSHSLCGCIRIGIQLAVHVVMVM